MSGRERDNKGGTEGSSHHPSSKIERERANLTFKQAKGAEWRPSLYLDVLHHGAARHGVSKVKQAKRD